VSVVGIVVREDGRVLVIRRKDNGTYQAPGGILEHTERVEDGVAREVSEETGYEIRALFLTGIYKNVKGGHVTLAFRCALVGGQATLNDEATEVSWFTVDEVTARLAEPYAVRVTDALSGEWPRVRHHDGTHLLVT
jgi:ADP-ribose pyrophosphatase YjhB (NUDIX family)